MSNLLQDETDGVVTLTLNRPEAMNALSSELSRELRTAIDGLAQRPEVRVVIITGAGQRAFCAGADLKERRTLDADEKWEQRTRLWEVNEAIWRMPQPVIAAVHGYCLGGGFELALYCDLRVAAEDAVFSFPEMTLGAYPGAGAAVVLPRLIGRGRAKEVFFTARRVKADEALSLGIVEHVVPRERLMEKAHEIADAIKKSSPLGLAGIKQMMNFGADLPFEQANELNDKLRRPLEGTQDYLEGITAFFEKRPARFTGR
ncbi:enoyl-CoA hydratase-related protein [Xanthobacter sp. VNH20]|uniref:enoyl-CoA hydratase/isomerase family protein n=1 Tax=Xanthobacter sp. VNH20 TaxID=3156616 RepID=UPI0032B46722